MNRPFDAKRYKRLLEGLEVSVVSRSSVSDDLRIDAEFFRKNYLMEDSSLAELPVVTLGRLAAVTDGPHGYHVVDEASPIAMLTAKCASDWFAMRDGADTIARWVDDANSRSRLAEGDLILSTRGTVGLCALVTQECLPANIDQDVARISIHNRDEVRPEYLVAYLNSRFGQDHITRHATGMVQQGLPLKKVREIPVPRIGGDVENCIVHAVGLALQSRRVAKEMVSEAEATLTAALGLVGWKSPQPLSYTRHASQAFAAGRLDAEYFEPEYAALRKHIRSMGGARLGDVVTEKIRRGISPVYVEDGDLPVINSQHVGKERIALEATRTTLKSLVAEDRNARTGRVRQWDVLLNSTGRITIGRCQCVLDDIDAVVDNHVSIIRPKSGLDPVYLASFLNSRFGLMLTEQSHTGSSGQIEMRPELIEDFEVWMAPVDVQAAIRTSVLEAHAAAHRARELLAAAQRAVEIAIEQDEAAALVYLDGFDVAT